MSEKTKEEKFQKKMETYEEKARKWGETMTPEEFHRRTVALEAKMEGLVAEANALKPLPEHQHSDPIIGKMVAALVDSELMPPGFNEAFLVTMRGLELAQHDLLISALCYLQPGEAEEIEAAAERMTTAGETLVKFSRRLSQMRGTNPVPAEAQIASILRDLFRETIH